MEVAPGVSTVSIIVAIHGAERLTLDDEGRLLIG